MKKLLLVALVLGVSTTIFGAATPCAPPPADVLSYNPDGCIAGSGLFSNFAVNLVAGAPGPVILVSTVVAGLDVTLNINPSLNNPVGAEEDMFSFTVTALGGGTILGVSASNGGNPVTSVHQIVCTGAITLLTGACAGTVLQDITLAGTQTTNGPLPLLVPGSYTTVNVWRDNQAPGSSTMTGGSVDFLFSPEPGVFVLMGSGLCALALLRRKSRV
jgi:hypothetical protein